MPTPRAAALVHLVAVGLCFASAAACSGAALQDVLATTPADSTGSPNGGTTDDGGATPGDGAAENDAGGDPAECDDEQEPNNSAERANALSPARCGSVGGDDGVDYLTFTLKPTTRAMSLNYSGRIVMTVAVPGGQTATIGDGDNEALPVVLGRAYTVQVRSERGGGRSTTWRVELVER